ncbi:MAG: NAD(P)H-hydrate dehydratase [Eubacterium sp.]|nr:NAD(P)H-hydrate dehydratase [Eubacterium sp.]
MEYFTTGRECAEIDSLTINEIGIMQPVLMERAGLSLAEEIAGCIDKKDRILVIAEGGNNGGDGIVAARILRERGYDATVFYICGLSKESVAFKDQRSIAKKCGVRFILMSDIIGADETGKTANTGTYKALNRRENILRDIFNGYDVLVDAIFGVGLSRNVGGVQAEVIDIINSLKEERLDSLKVIAADIPSGISSETGEILGTAVRADITVAFGTMKLGMLFGKGREYSGLIKTKDIGFPRAAFDMMPPKCYGLSWEDVKKLLPVRRADSNKGSFGRLLLVAGSKDISGAAILAGQAAMKMGTGLVKILTDAANRDIIGAVLPEALIQTYEKNENIVSAVKWASAVAIGPGIGTEEEKTELLKLVLDTAAAENKNVVLDADAINIISGNKDILNRRVSSGSGNITPENEWIITPHMLEMARLISEQKDDIREKLEIIKKNRFEVAKKVSNEYNVISVLKDARTVVAAGGTEEKFYINVNGNSGMAKGGSGDCLTGIIGALLAQGMKPYDSAVAGVFIHGASGDIAAKNKGMVGMTAQDLNDSLQKVFEVLY